RGARPCRADADRPGRPRPLLLDGDRPVSNAHQEVVTEVETALHRAPAECKVLATVLFVLAVALVPRGPVFWADAIDAVLLAIVAGAALTPPRLLAGRVAMEAPFVLFVILLPIVSGRAGLWLALG